MFKKLISTESLIVAAVIFLAIFFAKFPTLYHWLNTPKGYWYPKNTSWFDAWDTNFQVSYIRYGQRKGVMLENTYTTTPHKPVFIYQYYTGLGVLNRLLKLDPFILFHLASIITSVVLLFVCYFASRLFIKDALYRLFAFIIIALGGGLAWVSGLSFSADNKIAGFTLVNALERGHDALITFLTLLTFILIYLYMKVPKRKYVIWASVAGIIGMTFHPPMLGLYLGVAVVMVFIHYKENKNLQLLALPAVLFLALIVYGLIVLSNLFSNPGFSGVVAQNLFNADSLSVALGFGFLSPFIFWSLINDEKSRETFILKVFFLTQLFFLFLPSGFHLYYAKGIFAWGVLLGILGITSFIKSDKIQRTVLTFMVVTSLITRVNIFSNLVDAKLNNPFFFLTVGEGEALSFMSTLPADSGILSLYRIGNYIPAHSDNKVYYGHKFQTPDASEKLNLAKQFYLSDDKKLQTEFLKQNNIQYIYYGLEEKKLREDAKLPTENPFPDYLVVYQNDSATIYSVDQKAEK